MVLTRARWAEWAVRRGLRCAGCAGARRTHGVGSAQARYILWSRHPRGNHFSNRGNWTHTLSMDHHQSPGSLTDRGEEDHSIAIFIVRVPIHRWVCATKD